MRQGEREEAQPCFHPALISDLPQPASISSTSLAWSSSSNTCFTLRTSTRLTDGCFSHWLLTWSVFANRLRRLCGLKDPSEILHQPKELVCAV